jgi:hypothetical protein
MQKIILILLVLFPFRVFSQTNSFVTEYYLANNFTPKSGITPGSNNTLFMDCDQILERYYISISGITSTGERLPSQNQLSDNSTVPVVETLSPSYVIPNRIDFDGNVISDGGKYLISRGIRVYDVYNLDYFDSDAFGSPTTGQYAVSFIQLSQQTTYYYQAYATNSNGTGWGEILQATTPPTDYDNWAISGWNSSTIKNTSWVNVVSGTVNLTAGATPPATGGLYVNVSGIPVSGDSINVYIEFDGSEVFNETATSNGYLNSVSFYPLSTMSYAEESFDFIITFYLNESIVSGSNTMFVEFEECVSCYIEGIATVYTILPNLDETGEPTIVYPNPASVGGQLTIKNNHEANQAQLYSPNGSFLQNYTIYPNLFTQTITIPSGISAGTYKLYLFNSGSFVKQFNLALYK